jgi:hypothetical protein
MEKITIPVFGSLDYCLLCGYWDEDKCICPAGLSCPDIADNDREIIKSIMEC